MCLFISSESVLSAKSPCLKSLSPSTKICKAFPISEKLLHTSRTQDCSQSLSQHSQPLLVCPACLNFPRYSLCLFTQVVLSKVVSVDRIHLCQENLCLFHPFLGSQEAVPVCRAYACTQSLFSAGAVSLCTATFQVSERPSLCLMCKAYLSCLQDSVLIQELCPCWQSLSLPAAPVVTEQSPRPLQAYQHPQRLSLAADPTSVCFELSVGRGGP